MHTLFGEWVWRKRWEGNPINPEWKQDEFPTFELLRSRWAEEGSKLLQFVVNLTDESLDRKFHYVSTEADPHERLLWESMMHLVNHRTQHKTEAAAILIGFGYSPGDIDLIVLLNQV